MMIVYIYAYLYIYTCILYILVGNVVSIAFFNFSGISVTRELSATTRMVLDSLRTIVVWAVSAVWDPLNPAQIPGKPVLLTKYVLIS